VYYVNYLNYSKQFYDSFNNCVLGCYYEIELIAGAVCSIAPWPLVYLLKLLFARNMIETGTERPWKIQAKRYKQCREVCGIMLVVTLILVIVINSYLEAYFNPFNNDHALAFLYCLIGAAIWTFIVGELLAILLKSLFLWMAMSHEHASLERDGSLANCGRLMLTVFP
jgi:hypothetical protein